MNCNRIRPLRSESGVSTISYVLLAAGIAVSTILALGVVGRSTSDSFTEAGQQFDTGDSAPAGVGDDGAYGATTTTVYGGPADDTGPTDGESGDSGGTSGTNGSGGSAGTGGSSGGGTSGAAGGSGSDGSGDGDASEGTGSGDAPGPGGADGTGGSSGAGSAGGADGSGSEGTGSGDASGPGGAGGADDVVEASPDQEATAGLFAEFAVTFEVWDGSLVVGSVSAGAWRHEVVRDTGTRIHMLFTAPDGEQVLVKAWLNSRGVLKTRTNVLDD